MHELLGKPEGTPPQCARLHALSPPLFPSHLHHVLAHGLNLLQVPPHLVVELGKPVSHPEFEGAACLGEPIDVNGLHDALRDVHPPGRLKAVVRHGVRPVLEQVAQLGVANALLGHNAAQLKPLL